MSMDQSEELFYCSLLLLEQDVRHSLGQSEQKKIQPVSPAYRA